MLYSTRLILPNHHSRIRIAKVPYPLDKVAQGATNEQKLIKTMNDLVISNTPRSSAPAVGFKKSFSDYKSRKPKTFKL